jgi:hypothetical protein
MRVRTIVVVEGEKRLPSDPYPVHISQPDPSDNRSPPKMTKAHIVSTRLCPVFSSGSFQASSKVVHYFDSDFSSALKGLGELPAMELWIDMLASLVYMVLPVQDAGTSLRLALIGVLFPSLEVEGRRLDVLSFLRIFCAKCPPIKLFAPLYWRTNVQVSGLLKFKTAPR